MRKSRITLSIFFGLATLLIVAGSASAQVEVYATNTAGAATDFVYGQTNSASLRGTLDPPSGGEWVKVRQVAAASNCPSALGSEVPVLASFMTYVPAGNPVSVIGASTALVSSQRSTRLCIYTYWDVNGLGEANPNSTYSQVINFRDSKDTLAWFNVASAVAPELPYLAITGDAENLGAPTVAFIAQGESCPASFTGSGNSLAFPAPSTRDFIVSSDVPVAVGFWRACAYFTSAGGAPLAGETVFSRAPRGGWKPKYKLAKGKLRAKSGKVKLGTATCPGACRIQVVAKAGKKTLAKGTATGSGKIKLSAKLTSAGKNAARRGVKAKFTLTSVIDESTTSKSARLRLR